MARAFRTLVSLFVVGLVLNMYTYGLPAPLKEFFLSILEDFTTLCFGTVGFLINSCLTLSDEIQAWGQNICGNGPCPSDAPPHLVENQLAAYVGADLLRKLAYSVMEQGSELLSCRETLGTVGMWLAVAETLSLFLSKPVSIYSIMLIRALFW